MKNLIRAAASGLAVALATMGACGHSESPLPNWDFDAQAAWGGSAGASSGGSSGFKWDASKPDIGWDAPWPDGVGLDPDEQWIADASLWQPVPGSSALAKRCHALEPVAKLPIAPLSWSACGTGCELTDPVRLGDTGLAPAASTARDGSGNHAMTGIVRVPLASIDQSVLAKPMP